MIHPPATATVKGLTPAAGLTLYQRALPDGSVRIILIGTIGSGDVLHVGIPDQSLATSYGITKLAAADRVTFALIATAQFTLATRLIE